jgi:hypothetical protein
MDIQDIVAGLGSNPGLRDLAGKFGISPDQAQSALQGVLAHLDDGGSIETMAESVAAKAGLDPALVQKLLPDVTGLLQGHVEGASADVQSALSGVLGSLRGSPFGDLLAGLDADKDGSLVDEAMGTMKGMFGGKNA